MILWWPLMELLLWYLLKLVNSYNSLEEWVPVDKIYRHLIFKWVAVTSLKDRILFDVHSLQSIMIVKVNSLWPSDAIGCHSRAVSTLLQVMAWHLLGTKPFPEPMLKLRPLTFELMEDMVASKINNLDHDLDFSFDEVYDFRWSESLTLTSVLLVALYDVHNCQWLDISDIDLDLWLFNIWWLDLAEISDIELTVKSLI